MKITGDIAWATQAQACGRHSAICAVLGRGGDVECQIAPVSRNQRNLPHWWLEWAPSSMHRETGN